MNARIPLGGTLILMLAACTNVGPDYAVPAQAKINAASAQKPFMGATQSDPVRGNAPNDWWKQYNDEQLNHLVEEALAANTDLRIAAANLARSEAVVMEVKGAADVKASASASAVRARQSGEAFLLPTPIPVENLGDAGVNVSYQVDLVGGLKRAAEAATADAEASRAALDLARISIVADVALAYTETCAAGQELEIARHSLDLQQQNQDAVARLVAGGRRTVVDLPRANKLVDQTRSSIPIYTARQRIALYQLAVLTGHTPGEYPREIASCKQLPKLSSAIPVGDGAALLRRRPDVRQAERALAGATARIGIATAALYPNITLGLSDGATGILEHMGQKQTQRWSIGPLISWSMPGNLEKARLRQADASTDAALAHFDAVVLKALQEVENTLTVLARDLDRNTALRQARNETDEASREIQTLYRAGRLTYLDDLDAQRNLSTAEADLATSDVQVAIDQVKLFLALGGGWEKEVSSGSQPKLTDNDR
ncbi:efflux transporter outer membrane subunit [Sideroxydans sp. CL21]|uniref:efflux transporter outer membrane subunit n=1 Tax=Sideroxydans sp. CL21 TaxID=2600596 RepID=UPI0012A97EA3|nr:efflux transporter outer membrane subunit [Sideroxydans sp. CL21]VVC84417.1 Outer membrane component of tripartite multidrug resistance system [Sideroxydans sp. CL21]